MQITTIGLDLAKNVFQVHAIDTDGVPVVRKALRRSQVLPFFKELPPCLVGMEACGSAHFWARELTALGHAVRMMPPAYVKPYVKRGKTDAADAEAICEAVTRPTMRFVPIKNSEQQAVFMLHRVRSTLVRQRTMVMNALRGHLSEFGIVAAQGSANLAKIVEGSLAPPDQSVIPDLVRAALLPLVKQIAELATQIRSVEMELLAWHRQSKVSRRLETIPGVGFITATALTAAVGDPSHFKNGRQFAAWLGLTPRANSSGGKERVGRISRMGDSYLRTLLVLGSTSVLRFARNRAGGNADWINGLLARRPAHQVSVAMANKTARVVWAVLAREQVYIAPAPIAA
ncbi:IS110 family transposase [Novosphingobium sp. G106]|uniref:IS110 family transposase n=1 Tax=Novosphingobium sp. G106 TaxID=2849500 RepID=UPI001C2D8719|nr:IS110 family transposase [Novosphingobium sp. G106]MBV1692294.1 IS110 family transposase [Novosphingobium sp. G106]